MCVHLRERTKNVNPPWPWYLLDFESFKAWGEILCKYLTMVGSQDSDSSHTWSMTNYKLVKALSFSITSYLALLFEALKLNQSPCSVMTPSGLARMRPTLLPLELESPSIRRIYCILCSCIWDFFEFNPSSRIVHLTLKSTKTWVFIARWGR